MSASNFEIRRSKPGVTISGILPPAAAPIGTAFMVSAKDPDTGQNTFALASGRADGFVTKEIRVGPGLSSDEIAFGLVTYPSGELATPFEAGHDGSLERAEALEIEGDNYINSSSISAVTAAETILSFINGKFTAATSGQWASFRLVKQMTPVNGGACRIYVEAVHAYKV